MRSPPSGTDAFLIGFSRKVFLRADSPERSDLGPPKKRNGVRKGISTEESNGTTYTRLNVLYSTWAAQQSGGGWLFQATF